MLDRRNFWLIMCGFKCQLAPILDAAKDLILDLVLAANN